MSMKARMATACATALGAVLLSATAEAAENCEGEAGPGAATVTVRASGVQSTLGQVVFTLYPDAKARFLAPGGKLLRVRTRAVAPASSACFRVAPGAYAVAVYHDANGNKDFDRMLGSPVEGFAFSNNPPTRFGLPAFEAARFTVGRGGRKLAVQMRYLRPGDTSR
jgi:uncharacterized protein (DUF2141 family)